MKHSLLSAALILGSLTAASAIAQSSTQDAAPTQQHQSRHHNPHKQAMHLGKKLGLSDDQTARLEPILAQRHDQARAIRQNASLTPEERRTQIHTVNRSTQQQLASVLTPDQMQQWKSMRKQHRMHQQTATAPTGA